MNKTTPDGKIISTAKLNAISGIHTPPLADAVFELTNNTGVLNALESYLWKLYDTSRYGEFAAVVRTMYLLTNTAIPNEIAVILQSEDKEIYELFFYEFLMDLEETME